MTATGPSDGLIHITKQPAANDCGSSIHQRPSPWKEGKEGERTEEQKKGREEKRELRSFFHYFSLLLASAPIIMSFFTKPFPWPWPHTLFIL